MEEKWGRGASCEFRNCQEKQAMEKQDPRRSEHEQIINITYQGTEPILGVFNIDWNPAIQGENEQ